MAIAGGHGCSPTDLRMVSSAELGSDGTKIDFRSLRMVFWGKLKKNLKNFQEKNQVLLKFMRDMI